MMTGYEVFLKAARDVENIIRARPGVTEAGVAEGHQYMAGMWIYHLERAFKSYDVDRPQFVRAMDNFRTWGLPTPDHHYYAAQIDGEGEYKIMGMRGNVVDYCFEILSGLAGDDGVVGDRIDALELANVAVDADGRFELLVGGQERAKNWMKAGSQARTVFVRQTASDWVNEQPTPMLIERIDRTPENSSAPTQEQVDLSYSIAAENMVNHVRFLDDFSQNWAKVLPHNELPEPTVGPADAGYFPGQYNTKCYWSVDPGHALLITMKPSTAMYQSISLAHPLWFNSIDYRNIQSTLNGHQFRASSDGLVRFIVSPVDPGVTNWLDTGGQTEGFLFVRLQRLKNGDIPQKLDTKLVSLDSLLDEFPEDEPRTLALERENSLRIRRLSSDKRYF